MTTAEQRQRRRGSRRTDVASLPVASSAGGPGFLERVLSFETYTGFPHQEIGIIAGLWHAVDLWVRRGRRPRDPGA